MKRNPNISPPPGGARMNAAGLVILCLFLEAGLLIIFYGVYSETIALLSDVYLSELPILGVIFRLVDDEMTVTHMIALMLAFVSCYTPIYIWSVVLDQRIYIHPRAWLAEPGNQIIAAAALFVFVLIFAVEAINLYTLIARQGTQNPYVTGNTSPMMAFLAANKGLAIFVSILMAVINALIGFLTAQAVRTLKSQMQEAGS